MPMDHEQYDRGISGQSWTGSGSHSFESHRLGISRMSRSDPEDVRKREKEREENALFVFGIIATAVGAALLWSIRDELTAALTGLAIGATVNKVARDWSASDGFRAAAMVGTGVVTFAAIYGIAGK